MCPICLRWKIPVHHIGELLLPEHPRRWKLPIKLLINLANNNHSFQIQKFKMPLIRERQRKYLQLPRKCVAAYLYCPLENLFRAESNLKFLLPFPLTSGAGNNPILCYTVILLALEWNENISKFWMAEWKMWGKYV